MRAAAVTATGGVELIEVDEPEVGDGQVLIEVRAASVNRADLAVRAGTHGGASGAVGPTMVGLDAAGVVVGVGPGATGVRVGDRVMAMAAGGLAERVVVPAAMTVPIPASWSFVQGAGAIVGLMTEHNALRTAGRLAPGEAVVVHGAGSGVGLQGVQLARHLGAGPIIAVVRSARAEAVLRDLGADTVAVVEAGGPPSFATAVQTATGGQGADLVLDHVGGPYLAETVRCLAIGGRLVGIGRLGGSMGELDMEALAFKRAELIGVTFRTRDAQAKAAVVDAMRRELGSDIERLPPTIDRTMPWTEVEAAHELLRGGTPVGKLVLEVA